MAIQRIVLADEPLLREKSKKVRRITDDVQRLVDDMVETMRDAPGVGLAAPQVGALQRVVVMEVPVREEDDEEANPRTRLYVLINPEIIEMSEEIICADEGCLSVPGYVGEVERAAEVTVRYLNRAGHKMRLSGGGFLARVIQHEVDHLDGVLYTDRLTSLDTLRPVEPGTEEEAELEAAMA
ncbi:MAG: peptide deformylase [Chloroflexi bacterium]|nr:peptide deformylase [Chloroflexota bacterium]MBU1748016.1 peptide deformylase [Chloroflexota bacterium]